MDHHEAHESGMQGMEPLIAPIRIEAPMSGLVVRVDGGENHGLRKERDGWA